jgi:predicted transcriptional regulator
MTTSELRDKDHHILQQIHQGNNDVQKITSATTHENHHVTYSFQKLEDLGLVEVLKPEGTVERIIDGQKRVFQHPKQAELTDKGKQTLEETEQEELGEYEDMSHNELVEKVHQLENELSDIRSSLESFKNKFRDGYESVSSEARSEISVSKSTSSLNFSARSPVITSVTSSKR